MASSTSSIANLFSFFTPFKPPPTKAAPPPQLPHLSISSNPLPSLSTSSKDGLAPLVPSIDNNNNPLSSSSCSNELMSVVCPSLAYSNTLFFKSAYNVQVIVDDNEPEEKLLNRFRREVMRAGVIQECKRRRFHENKQDEKKRKTREAAKRNRRRRPFSRNFTQDKQEASRSKREDEEEDNWELPEGALPY